CLFTNICQDEAQAYTTLGKTLILCAGFRLGGFFVLEGATGLGEIGVDLCPDVVELGLDELGGCLELVLFVECIQDLTLRLLAGPAAILAFNLAANVLTQLLGTLKSELLCHLVVDFQFAGLCDCLDLDVEGRFLASEMRGW